MTPSTHKWRRWCFSDLSCAGGAGPRFAFCSGGHCVCAEGRRRGSTRRPELLSGLLNSISLADFCGVIWLRLSLAVCILWESRDDSLRGDRILPCGRIRICAGLPCSSTDTMFPEKTLDPAGGSSQPQTPVIPASGRLPLLNVERRAGRGSARRRRAPLLRWWPKPSHLVTWLGK